MSDICEHNMPEHLCTPCLNANLEALAAEEAARKQVRCTACQTWRNRGQACPLIGCKDPTRDASKEKLEADRDAWKARANKFEATVEMLEARAEADLLNAEAAISRATQAEAQAAAMLATAAAWRDRPCPRGELTPCPCCGEAGDHMADETARKGE